MAEMDDTKRDQRSKHGPTGSTNAASYDSTFGNAELVRYRRHSEANSSGRNYSDAARWQRWIEGTVAKYRWFQRDYEKWAPGAKADPKVLREIEHEIRRAESVAIL